jgi:hypothetical protein
VIDGLFANGFNVSGGTFGVIVNRGGSLTLANCQVTGASNTGVIAANNSVVSVDNCTVTGNGSGVAATARSAETAQTAWSRRAARTCALARTSAGTSWSGP